MWSLCSVAGIVCRDYIEGNQSKLEIVMNELGRFKHSADFLANSSHIIESAAIFAS